MLLGDHLDSMVQTYVKRLRESGGAISPRIIIVAARGIILATDKSKLQEFGGPLRLNQFWANSLLERMQFVKRKATTAKSKLSIANFAELKLSFLDDVCATVDMEEIPLN